MWRSAGSPLLLSYEFPPKVYGGLGRHVTGLSTAMAATGAAPMVGTLGPPQASDDDPPGVRVQRTAPVPAVGDVEDWLASILAFDSALTEVAAPLREDVAVVHAHDWLVARTAFALTHAFTRPLVVTVHATERGRHQGWLPGAISRYVDAVERWLVESAAGVIVCSEAMRREVCHQWALDGDRVTVIPNGVERSDVRRAPEQGLVVFAGRLEHEKGGQVLLDAVARLRRRGVPARLIIAGTGSQEPAWRKVADTLGIARDVRFLGRVDFAELDSLYARAAVVAVPSLYEPFGMVAAEAMSAGAPVVASEVGGLPEVVGAGGRMAPPGDAGALADAMQDLLTSEVAGRAGSAAAARRAAQLATWDDVAARTLAVYAAVTERDRRHAWTG